MFFENKNNLHKMQSKNAVQYKKADMLIGKIYHAMSNEGCIPKIW